MLMDAFFAVAVTRRKRRAHFHEFMAANNAELMQEIKTKKILDDDLTERLRKAIDSFKVIA